MTVDEELAFCHKRREQARDLVRKAQEEIVKQNQRIAELIDEKADALH